MNKKTIAKRKLHEECWNLDVSFIKWLQIRLPIYLHDAERIVDLDYSGRIFVYQGQPYTLKALIVFLNSCINSFFNCRQSNLELRQKLEDQIFDIWNLIGQYLWW